LKMMKCHVPTFYSDPDKDEMSFKAWNRAVCNTLKVNKDYFRDDEAKQAFIESKLGGNPSKDLEPYLADGHPFYLDSSDELLKHLVKEYTDPNEKQKARTDFKNLALQPNGDFSAFKNEFIRLVAECRLGQDLWKEEMND